MKKNIISITFFGLSIIWMTLIFYFSHQTGDDSSSTSEIISKFIARIFVSDFDEKSLAYQTDLLDGLGFVVRKLAHMTEYFILFLFLSIGFWQFFPKKYWIIAFSISLVYACSDEFHQLFINGRSGSIVDVLVDVSGIIMVILLIGTIKELRKHWDLEVIYDYWYTHSFI